MKKQIRYRYLGRNGIITSPILLENIEPIIVYLLTADEGKVLYNGNKKAKAVEAFSDELDQWVELYDETFGQSN
jgi:hypothetical protein